MGMGSALNDDSTCSSTKLLGNENDSFLIVEVGEKFLYRKGFVAQMLETAA